MKSFLCLFLVAPLMGCTFAQRAHVAWLDPEFEPGHKAHSPFAALETQRLLAQPSRTNIEVFQGDHKPDRPYREIAVFSVDGNGNEEPDAIQAFVDLARHARADALLVTAAAGSAGDRAGHRRDDDAGGTHLLLPNQRYVFRATAVVWTDAKPPP